MKSIFNIGMVAVLVSMCIGCGGGISSDEQARRAYLGLDKAIGKCLTLGFAGFNAANSANIDPQSTTGDKSGTLTVTGQVDQGASTNKGMRLNVGMVDYSDGDVVVNDAGEKVEIVYNTAEAIDQQPDLDMQLKNIPTGTFSGTLVGEFQMTKSITAATTVNLAFSGELESNGSGGTQRKLSTTVVTGTVTSGGGNYNVDLKI
jgi:hypothetical protein